MPGRGHRPSSSLTGLLVFDHDNINDDNDGGDGDQSPRPELLTTDSSNNSIDRRSIAESAATARKSLTALFPLPLPLSPPLSFISSSSEKQQQQPRPQRRTVSLRIFVSSLLCFCALTLALGLGLGLGLGSRRWQHNNNSSVVYGPLLPPSNYSTYYGVSLPTDMEVIPIEQLVNATELDLDTGFVVEAAAGSGGVDSSRGVSAAGKARVREYTFDVTQALAAPDGFQKPMILVNGQSPGPLIEANTGDVVRVRVNNRLRTRAAAKATEATAVVADDGGGDSSRDGDDYSDGHNNKRSEEGEGEGEGNNAAVTIHWHGIDQHGTPWMDGVAGVSQCGIPAGSSFTYEFRVADQRGTFWWHAHLSVQYSDGVYGPIVRFPP